MAHPSLLKTEVWGSTGKSLPIIDHMAGAGRDPYQSWHSGDKSCLWITLQPFSLRVRWGWRRAVTAVEYPVFVSYVTYSVPLNTVLLLGKYCFY